MNLKTKIILFISFVILEWYLDDLFPRCQSPFGRLLMIIHHAIVVFHLLGPWIFGLYWYHLVISFIIIGGWKVFGHCIFTRIHNTICNIPDKRKHVNLVSVALDKLQMPFLYHPLYESYCWFLVCYDLYHIRFPM